MLKKKGKVEQKRGKKRMEKEQTREEILVLDKSECLGIECVCVGVGVYV